jgi:hypothetical protein
MTLGKPKVVKIRNGGVVLGLSKFFSSASKNMKVSLKMFKNGLEKSSCFTNLNP